LEYAVEATVTEPPRETADPFTVIDEFASLAFVIDPSAITASGPCGPCIP